MENDDNEHTELSKVAEDRTTENPSLGTHLGYEVHIAVRRVPEGAAYPDDFGVNLYIPRSDGDNIDIARVDTDHGDCHIDRFYLPKDHEKRHHDFDFSTKRPEGAIAYFTADDNWREWVERYEENHGLP